MTRGRLCIYECSATIATGAKRRLIGTFAEVRSLRWFPVVRFPLGVRLLLVGLLIRSVGAGDEQGQFAPGLALCANSGLLHASHTRAGSTEWGEPCHVDVSSCSWWWWPSLRD